MSDDRQTHEQTSLDILRHSTTHVMAKAVQRLFPGSMLGIGPPIEDGFYYDIDVAGKQQILDHVEDEQCLHRIIGKALAGFSEA